VRGPYRGFLKVYSGVLLGALASVAALNVAVDPYRAFGRDGGEASGLGLYKTADGSRITKSQRLVAGDLEVVMVGSSRLGVAFDPHHRVFDGMTTYNAGLHGAEFGEILASAEYAVEHNPGLRRVVMVLDYSYFDAHRQPSADFLTAKFHPAYKPVDYWGRLLLGGETIERSMQTLSNRKKDKRRTVYDAGQRTGPILAPEASQRQEFVRFLEGRHLRRFEYDESDLESLRGFLSRCVVRGIAVSVVIAPMHATVLEDYAAEGLWPGFEDWKRGLASAVESAGRVGDDAERGVAGSLDSVSDSVSGDTSNGTSPGHSEGHSGGGGGVLLWDFAVMNDRTTEAVPAAEELGHVMRWFWDPVHFRVAYGDDVLDEVLGGKPGGVGVRLTRSNLEAHLSRQRERVAGYKSGLLRGGAGTLPAGTP